MSAILTLTEIAHHAGLGLATADRVIHVRDHTHPAPRDRVEAESPLMRPATFRTRFLLTDAMDHRKKVALPAGLHCDMSTSVAGVV